MSSSLDHAQLDKSVAPKRVEKLGDLPSGKVVDEEWMSLTVAARENFLVFAPDLLQERGQDRRVWIIQTPKAASDLSSHVFELRKRVARHKMVVKGTTIAPVAVLKTLYENAASNESSNANAADENRGEMHELFDEMVQYSLRETVSDIHIEKRSTRSVVRMRKHGQLFLWREISNASAHRLCAVIYNVLAENKEISFRAESDFQMASVNREVLGEEVKLRYQSLPAYPGGFDVVLRVLPIGSDEESVTSLQSLGYATSQVDAFIKISNRPTGAAIIAGTTGSGKSTTLKNLIMYINQARHYRCKIFTIEDPPEYKIPRVTQVPVVRHSSDDPNLSPFLDPLKACMRGDPDILMIGEIRDFHTGDGLKKATQSGHQVLSTVHATSALGIIERLADFGITPSVMGSPEFLTGLIYQKLMPTLCPHCSVLFSDLISSSQAPTEYLALAERLERVADLDLHPVRLRGEGCAHCKQMGISGRTVCAEIIAPDYKMLEFFSHQDPLGAKKYWRSLSDRDPDSDNMVGKTVLEHALFKMRRGLICPLDIEGLLGPVDDSWRSWNEMQGTGPSL